MIFVTNSSRGREANMINTLSKRNFRNRVGERGVNLNLANVFRYTGFFGGYPLVEIIS